MKLREVTNEVRVWFLEDEEGYIKWVLVLYEGEPVFCEVIEGGEE